MTWIAIADHAQNLFCAQGLHAGKGAPDASTDDVNRFLPRGSIMLETYLSAQGRLQDLLGYHRAHPWKSGITLQAVPGGGIVLVITQGNQVFHAALDHPVQTRTDVVRITYSWDAPRKWGRLSVEFPGTTRLVSVILKAPKPLYLADIKEMTSTPGLRRMDDDVVFFAVSDRVEPIGPTPSLTATTPILTPSGYRPVGKLKRGDVVTSDDGNILPILQMVHRTVPARGTFEPVRLRHPYFELQRDVIVGPLQRLVMGGSRVEYMFGTERVLVPARHVVNGTAAVYEKGHAVVTYSQILLPDHEAVIAAGTAVESLDIGRIRRKPNLLAESLLSGFERALLPDHSVTAYPVLRPFDAITLAEERAA
jgi:hypothetical protein